MSKLKQKLERATAVILVMPGGKHKQLAETERHALIHATSGHLQNWEQRCSVLYQVIGCLADTAGLFETSDDVADALDVAAGRGDVEKLLPWPKDYRLFQSVTNKLKGLSVGPTTDSHEPQ